MLPSDTQLYSAMISLLTKPHHQSADTTRDEQRDLIQLPAQQINISLTALLDISILLYPDMRTCGWLCGAWVTLEPPQGVTWAPAPEPAA